MRERERGDTEEQPDRMGQDGGVGQGGQETYKSSIFMETEGEERAEVEEEAELVPERWRV